MADEGLSYIIGVYVDAEGVGADLEAVDAKVAASVANTNKLLEGLGQVDSFAKTIAGTNNAVEALARLTAEAATAKDMLGLAAEQALGVQSLGIGARVTGIGDIQKLIAATREYQQVQNEMARSQGAGAPTLRTTASGRIQSTETGRLVSKADAEAIATAFQEENRALTVGLRELEAQLIVIRDITVASERMEASQRRQAELARATAAARSLPPITPPPSGEFKDFTPISDEEIKDRYGNSGMYHAIASDPTESAAFVAQRRAEQAAANLASVTDVHKIPGLEANVVSSLTAQQKTAEALARQGELQKEFNQLQAAGIELTKVELAQMRLLTAELALAEASEKGIAGGTAAGNRLKTNVVAQQANLAKAQADALAAPSGPGGFGTGFREGLFGNKEGGGASEIGNQVAQVAKYAALYQAFTLIEEAIKDSISEVLEFERGVTNLSIQLGISRDSARGLATNLGNVAAANGLAPSQGVALGQQFAGVFAGEGAPSDLATQGATLGSQLAVVSGNSKDAAKNLADATASTKAFNLTSDDTSRVLDAATTAAQHFLGSADPTQILPGLAQIGDLASQAGLSLEQTANLLGDVQSRTGDTSAAAAGELRRVLGREAQPAFQAVFSQTGIDTTLPFQQELEQLSLKYDTLSDKQKAYISNQFGGARAGAAAVATIEDYAKVQDEANKSIQEGGAFSGAYAAKIGDVKGLITQLSGEFKNLAKDFGETGVFAGLGVVLETVKPLVQTVDDLLQLFNKIPAPIRESAIAIAEIAVAVKAITTLGVGGIISKIPGLGGRGAGAAEGGAVDGALATTAVGITESGGAVVAALAGLAGELAVEGAIGPELAGGAGLAGRAAADDVLPAAEGLGGRGGGRWTRNTSVGQAARDVGGALTAERDIAGIASGAVGGLKTAATGLLDAIGPLGVAIIGLVAIDEAYKASTKQEKAISQANSEALIGTTSDELKSTANAFANDAKAARQSSSGIVGSVVNTVRSDVFGGEDTTTVAKRAQARADLANYEATQLDKATSKATVNDASNQIDVSVSGGITQGLANLKASGHDATQQLDALHEKLTNFADAASAGANTLARGQSLIISQQIANTATDRLNTYAQIDVDAGNKNKSAASQFLKQDQQGINSLLNSTANDYFASQGLDQGGAVSAAQQTELAAKEVAALKARLKANHFSDKDIKALDEDITQAAVTSVHQRIADANALAGGTLSQDQIGQVLADAPALIQQEGQQKAAQGSLSGNSQGGALAGATASLARARQLYADLARSGADAQSLLPLADEIDQLQLAAQQALVAHIGALGQLAQSLVSPFDKSGGIAAQISTAQSQLAVTTDADAKAGLQANINKLIQQQAQQSVSDANAARDAGVASGDAEGKAVTSLQDAQASLAAIVATGVSSGQDYFDALAKVNDAQQAAIDSIVSRANALTASRQDPRATQQNDLNAVGALALQIANTPQFGADGQQTEQYSQLITAQKQAQLKVLQDQVDVANAVEKANSDQSNPTAQLLVQLDAVNRNLQTVDVGDAVKTANDIAAAKALVLQIIQRQIDVAIAVQNAERDPRNVILGDQQAIGQDKLQIANDGGDAKKRADDEAKLKADRAREAQDLVAQANAQRDSAVRAGDPLGAAYAALSDARSELSLDLKGSQKYFDDLIAVHQAQAGLAQALADHAKEEALLAGDTTDPVASALADLKAARVKLAEDRSKKTGDLDADLLAVETASQAAQKAKFDQTFSAQQTAYSLHEESGAQYLKYLTSQDAAIRKQLSGMKKGQEGYQQMVDELNQIDGAIQGLNDQLQGQFNLGDIKLPTVYEVRRSVAASAAGQAIDASSVQNVNVTINGADFQAVVNYINGVLGGRGATATVATTGRKAA